MQFKSFGNENDELQSIVLVLRIAGHIQTIDIEYPVVRLMEQESEKEQRKVYAKKDESIVILEELD